MSPEDQFRFVADFNWDDPLDPIVAVLDSSHCTFETALLAFWRLEGPWHYIGHLPHHRHAGLLDRLAHDLESSRYGRGSISYDPLATEGISKTQLDKLRKAGVPETFLTGEQAKMGAAPDQRINRTETRSRFAPSGSRRLALARTFSG